MQTLREFLSVPVKRRGIDWLRAALQQAVELEFATIPPYLTAMWSIRDEDHPVALLLRDVAMQEMGHMALACNLLTTLEGTPQIAETCKVPTYPGPLPAHVHPGLVVPLERVSRPLVERVFMEIEKPEFGPVAWYRGEAYPTIGAFYSAIFDAFLALKESQIKGVRQRALSHVVYFQPARTQVAALRAVSTIQKQGEGTVSGPLFGLSAADVAHYYRFGEVFHERRLEQGTDGHWDYTGDLLPFPCEDRLFPMAPVPAGGYQTADAQRFDDAFSAVLRDLQSAWTLADDQQADDRLARAVLAMKDKLPPLARCLMQTRIDPPKPETYGPNWKFVAVSPSPGGKPSGVPEVPQAE